MTDETRHVCQHGRVPCASWIIVAPDAEVPIIETWSDAERDRLVAKGYLAVRPCAWLARLNRR